MSSTSRSRKQNVPEGRDSHNNCSNYKGNRGTCQSTHYIRVDFLEEVVLGEIRRLTKFASLYEDDFLKAVIGHSQQADEADRKLKEKELKALLARDEELDGLFERIYEDNVSGKISDERFSRMSRRYEDEQKELTEKIKQLRSEIEKQSSCTMTTDKPRDWREGMKHSSTAQTMRHLRVEVMELCESAGLYQIDLLNGSKERVSEAEYWARRRGQLKLDRENAALTAAGQPPRQKKFETVKDTLRKQISSVLYRATSFEDFSDRLLQQYGIAVKESRGCLSYLPAGRTKFIRAKHLGDKFEKEQVLVALAQNIRLAPTIQPIATDKPDKIQKLVDIQAKLKQGKGIGYERWAKKHNLKAMAQTLILLQEKGLLNEDALDQRITELDTKFHDSLAVVKDLEGRMKANKELRYHVAAYTNTKNIAQQLKAAKRPAAFEEQHRAELTTYRTAAAYFKANDITKLPSPKKLEAEYAQLASEKAKFYEQYKEAKEELLKLKTAKQNVASFFREEEQTQQER